ncbi:hypothetical protein VPH35_055616 [Triticum aestivum]
MEESLPAARRRPLPQRPRPGHPLLRRPASNRRCAPDTSGLASPNISLSSWHASSSRRRTRVWRPLARWLWSLVVHGIEVEAAAACICDAVRTHRTAMAPPWWYELEPMRRSSHRVHPCRWPHTQLRAIADARVAAVVVGNTLRLAWRGRWPPRRRPRSALLPVISASGHDLQPSHRPAPSSTSAAATHELRGPSLLVAIDPSNDAACIPCSACGGCAPKSSP